MKTFAIFTKRYNGRHYVTLLNLKTTIALSHDVISLPDARRHVIKYFNGQLKGI